MNRSMKRKLKVTKPKAKAEDVNILTISTAVLTESTSGDQQALLFGNGDDNKVYQWDGANHEWLNT